MLQKNRITWFFVVAVLFNILYIMSVFDTYFKTFLSPNLPSIPQTASAPAERIVIFLADGTKADTFFSLRPDGKPVAPFFRSIIETKGSYGVSHTGVPTESRTCSVAIMGGFYEDPSGVTKGWSENPVDYDHLFNQTAWAWAIGTPDIVSLFYSSGNKPQSVNVTGYSHEQLDFAGVPSKLDDWVVSTFTEILDKHAVQNKTLNDRLRTPKIGILLHLIAADTTAHSRKPYSPEYYDVVSHYDQLIKDTVAKIDAFYGDSKTAYIYTSDHGLVDAGSHGDGALNNTRTPFVAWGAGLSKPIKEKVKGESHDELSKPWKLEGLTRRDIHQVDITPLMASLIGVPVPVNNLGMLPVEYLDVDKKSQSEFLLTNAKQICTIYETKNQAKKKDEPFFISYKVSVQEMLLNMTSIENAIKAGKYDESQARTRQLIEDCREGINYIQRYDWLLLFSIIVLGYIGFSVFGFTTIRRSLSSNKLEDSSSDYSKKLAVQKLLYILFSISLMIYFLMKKAPIQYYGYAIFPLYFWFDFFFQSGFSFKGIGITKSHVGYALFFTTFLGLLLWAQFERKALSLTYIAIGIWQIVTRRNQSIKMLVLWGVSCLVMSLFPMLPPIGAKDGTFYTLGWLLTIAFIAFGTYYWKEKMTIPSIISKVTILVSFYIANNSDSLMASGSGVPAFNKGVAWIILVMTIVFPILFDLNSKNHFMLRLLSLFTCLASLMIILSTSYELLFFACFSLQLVVWIYMEKVPNQLFEQTLTFNHQKNGFFILFFASVAFFGMGNLASISFNLESVFRFMTVFSPFAMSGLLIIRIMLPFVILAAAVVTFSKHSLKLPSISVLVIPMLSLGSALTLTLFFLVKNTGSWLEMGSSLARFIIASVFIIIILVLVALGHLLMKNTKNEDKKLSLIGGDIQSMRTTQDSLDLYI